MFRIIERFLKWVVRRFYGVEVYGAENVPAEGPALLLSNHVSYIDVVLITAVFRRRVHFMMWRRLYEMPILGFIARRYGAIPVSPTDGPQAMRKSLEAAVQMLKDGHLVCLFPEGSMTRTAHLQPFKRGFEIIARRGKAPIIPIHMDRIWGSIFSFKQGRYFLKMPKFFGHPVRVSIGKPQPSDTARETLRRKIMELEVDAYAGRKFHQRPLHAEFLRNAKRAWWWPCITCSTGKRLTWGGTLARSLALARFIRKHCKDENMVGVMLPASAHATLLNIAIQMTGKTPVNLNYTGAHKIVDDIIRRCKIKTVFTDQSIVAHFGFEWRPEFKNTEEVFASLSGIRIAFEYCRAYLTPRFIAERTLIHRGTMDDLATVMFTQGATGQPKGVMLTHQNIVTNIEAVTDALRLDWRDMLMGVLPPFHAFGYTVALWLPLVSRIRTAYHANPLDAKGIGRMVREHGATMLIGTPSFFAIYSRGCRRKDFESLRLAIAGGQKLRPDIAENFEQHFGIPLHEGYGCTELSPIVSVNVPDVNLRHDTKQMTAKLGSVGRPIPGLLVDIMDLKNHQPVQPGETGMVLVKGPSIMRSYMDDPSGTALAIRDGWYYTRDVGALDEDGFLYIHGRTTRLSKVAGETVQHAVVEEALAKADASDKRRFLVVSVPDTVRGQRLAVLYDGPAFDAHALTAHLAGSDLPNLWRPEARDFVRVEAIPMLDTGFPDDATGQSLAEERLAH